MPGAFAWWSTRSNKGQGRAAHQLETAGEAVQHRKKPHKTTFDASANTSKKMSANPMAPEAAAKCHRHSKVCFFLSFFFRMRYSSTDQTTTASASNNATESQVASTSHPQHPCTLYLWEWSRFCLKHTASSFCRFPLNILLSTHYKWRCSRCSIDLDF